MLSVAWMEIIQHSSRIAEKAGKFGSPRHEAFGVGMQQLRWDLISYCAGGLKIKKSVLIAHLTKREVWNLVGDDQEPPCASTLYKGPRKGVEYFESDVQRIRNGIHNYAQQNGRVQAFEKLLEGLTQPTALRDTQAHSHLRSPLKKKGDVRFTGFVYVIKSISLADDSGKPSVKYGYGYFVLRREIVRADKAPLAMVTAGKAWFFTDALKLFAQEDMRGRWNSEYVGLSLHDVLIVYDFHFDPHLGTAEGYKGLITAKVNENEPNKFGGAERAVATGEFYYLSDPSGGRPDATQVRRRSGQFYIERIQDLVDPRDGDTVLRAALQLNREKIGLIFE